MSVVAGWVALGVLAWVVVAFVVGPPIGRYLKRRQQDSEPLEDLEAVADAAGVYRDRTTGEGT